MLQKSTSVFFGGAPGEVCNLMETEDSSHRRMTAQHKSNLGDDATFIALPTDDWTKCSNPVWRIICARRILAKIITTTHGHDSTSQVTPRQEEDITCPTTHRPSDAYGDFALTVNCSGARTSAWHGKSTQCWLMLIRMSGWSAPRKNYRERRVQLNRTGSVRRK